MKLQKAFLWALLILFFNAGVAPAVDVEDPAPSFELKTLNGGVVRYDDIRGRAPLFIVFWATWCPVCKEEIPRLKEIYSEFRPKGLEFLAINVGINDSEKRAKRYVKKYDIPYPVVFDNGSTVTRLYSVQGTPTIIIVDKSGVVRYRSASVPEDLGEHFDSLLE